MYKVGDRVVCNHTTEHDLRPSMFGKTATLARKSNTSCWLLKFDEWVDGHEGDGGQHGYYWFVHEDDFTYEKENLKFKKGDVVEIVNAECRSSYERILGRLGTIVDATYTRYVDDERITYRVRIDDAHNDYQLDGLWVFHDEKSLQSCEPAHDDQQDAYEYVLRSRQMHKEQLLRPFFINKNYGITRSEDNMRILEIYNDRRSEKINKKYDDMEFAIKMADERYKVWKGCVDTLLELYKEDEIVANAIAPIKHSEDTKNRINSNDKLRLKELKELHEKMLEVEAQLMECETYEQKQEILKAYKIIKENGKINA